MPIKRNKKQAKVIAWPGDEHGPAMVVLDRGWVFVAHSVVTDKEWVTLKGNVRCIRRWGTTHGLGQLCGGPLPNTVLDPVNSEVLKAPLAALNHIVPCQRPW